MKTRDAPPEKGQGKDAEGDDLVATTEVAGGQMKSFKRLAKGVLGVSRKDILSAEKRDKKSKD